MKTIAMLAGLGMLMALPAGAQDLFFYPTQGQSPEQQAKDRGECQAWAQQQTASAPASPPPLTTAAPAPVPEGGALLGGFRRADQRRAQARRQAAAQQQYEAQLAQEHDSYNRALAACIEGRGYSVN